jgi:hypothetical protein
VVPHDAKFMFRVNRPSIYCSSPSSLHLSVGTPGTGGQPPTTPLGPKHPSLMRLHSNSNGISFDSDKCEFKEFVDVGSQTSEGDSTPVRSFCMYVLMYVLHMYVCAFIMYYVRSYIRVTRLGDFSPIGRFFSLHRIF